jgi:hypothetical protein
MGVMMIHLSQQTEKLARQLAAAQGISLEEARQARHRAKHKGSRGSKRGLGQAFEGRADPPDGGGLRPLRFPSSG